MTPMGFLTFTSHRAPANPFQSPCFSLNHYLLCSRFFQAAILFHLHNINASNVLSICGIDMHTGSFDVILKKFMAGNSERRRSRLRKTSKKTDNSGTLCLDSQLFWKDVAGYLQYTLLPCGKHWPRMLIIFKRRRCKDQTNIKTNKENLSSSSMYAKPIM